MEQLLRQAVKNGASDLHITVGVPPILRVNGTLVRTEHQLLTVENTEELFISITTTEQ